VLSRVRDVRAALLFRRLLPARQLPVSRHLLPRHILAVSVDQNVIIQAIHVNYTSWYGKLSENYADSKK